MSEKILIRNADAIVTCDDADRVLCHSDILSPTAASKP